MKSALAVAVAALTLAGCSTTSKTASFDAPRVTSPGTTPIRPGLQHAFCQDQVADMFGAKRQNATTGNRVVAADGGTTIEVAVDKGNEGVRSFKCRLDGNNRFVDVVATSEAAL